MKIASRGNPPLTVAFLSPTWLFLSWLQAYLKPWFLPRWDLLPSATFFSPVPRFSPLRFQLRRKHFYGTAKRSSENWHFIYKVNSRDSVFPFDFQIRPSTQVTLGIKKKEVST